MVLLMMFGTACAGALVGVPWYMGVFKQIKFFDTKTEPWIFVFAKHVGPYQNVGSAVFSWFFPLPNLGKEHYRLAMMCLDNPQQVEPGKLRSMAGLWLHPSRSSELDGLLKQISEAGGPKLTVREIKSARAKHAFFPFRNQLSFMLGPMKVYSAAYTALDAPPCGSVEVYHEHQIEYIFAMENPEDYSWPED